MIARVLLIAGNTVRAVVDRRAIYIWGAAILLTLMRAAPGLFFGADDENMRAVFHAQAISGALETWSALSIAAAIFIGAGAVAADIASKTLITVLARPIARWEVVTGKWLGLTMFGVLSMVIGAAFSLVMAAWVGMDVDYGALALAFAHTAVSIALFGGIAVAMSAVGPSTLAASVAVLVVFVPALVGMLESVPDGPLPAIGRAIGSVTPIGFENHYRRVPAIPEAALQRTPSMRRGREPLPEGATARVLGENAAFTAMFLLAGCAGFSRRDVKI